MASEGKNYAVVKFLSDSTFSEIPVAWIMKNGDNEYCWWPPRTANCKTLMTKCTVPNYSTWTRHKVNVIKLCASLEYARKSAADSMYETTTDEDQLGRGKRRHISYNPYEDDEDEADNTIPKEISRKKQVCSSGAVSVLPPAPSNFAFNTILDNASSNNTIIEMSDQTSQEQTFSEIPIILQDYTSLDVNMQEDFNLKENIKKMMRMQAASNITLKEMHQRLIKIESSIKRNAHDPSRIDDSIIAPFLPLETTDNVKEFDSLLKKSEEPVKQFKQLLLKTGGSNAKDNIHRCLTKIITNTCAIKCSWKGQRNNFRVCDLHFIKIMKRHVTSQYSTCTESHFDSIASEWLRFSQQRKKREVKENIPMEENIQE